MPVEVLHVTQRFSLGGAGQALVALIEGSTRVSHRLVSLVNSDSTSRSHLASRRISLIEQPSPVDLENLIADTDVIQIHFWNTPELYEFMSRPVYGRTVVWSHVAGTSAPHVVTPEIEGYADFLVATGRPFSNLGTRQCVIQPRSPRALACQPVPARQHDAFTVGIFGSLDSSRCDPHALDVFAAADLPDARLLVVGSGDLPPIWKSRAQHLGLLQRVEFTGFTTDIWPQLLRMDVLLHMPRSESFATSDLSLQEAMLAGVVPVVTEGTAVSDLVKNNVDGLLATDGHMCVRHLRALYEDPERVKRMRDEGLRRARAEFTPRSCAEQFGELYQELMQEPARRHQLPLADEARGAQRFIASLGSAAEAFQISAARSAGWQEADCIIASSPPALVGPGAGGILHYRGFYPEDPILRYWAGLVFAAQGRRALAAAEFAASANAGWLGGKERLEELTAGAGSR